MVSVLLTKQASGNAHRPTLSRLLTAGKQSQSIDFFAQLFNSCVEQRLKLLSELERLCVIAARGEGGGQFADSLGERH
jgi:hypothetical protein